MKHTMIAASGYFGLVFAAGFVLGTIRTLLILPLTGDVVAVGLELPAMLAVSWIACGWSVRRYEVSARFSTRLAMGVVAFGLLMGAEVLVSMLIGGRSLSEHLALYRTAPSLLGLGGQMAFAAFPLIRLR